MVVIGAVIVAVRMAVRGLVVVIAVMRHGEGPFDASPGLLTSASLPCRPQRFTQDTANDLRQPKFCSRWRRPRGRG